VLRTLLLALTLAISALILLPVVSSADASVIHSSYSNVTSESATLEAQINPGGSPTTYYFEYKNSEEVECEDLEGCGTVVGKGGPLTGTTPQAVPPAQVTGLTPGKTYIFWVIVKKANEYIAHRGGEESFKTPAANTASPSIDNESVSNVTEHDATLDAEINTNDVYTGYWFQIDTNSRYNFTQFDCPWEFPGTARCQSITDGEPLSPGLVEPEPEYIPAGADERSVSLDLASIGATLQPATTYHYRVLVASSGANGGQGPDQTFTTPSTQTPPTGGNGPSGTAGTSTVSGGSVSTPASTPLLAALGNGSRRGEPKVLTRGQRLAAALKACEKKPKKQRAKCKQQAEKNYASPNKKSHKHRELLQRGG
jgi:hypothetical protein